MNNTRKKPSFPRSRVGMPTGLKSSRSRNVAPKSRHGMDSHGGPWELEQKLD